MSIWLKVMREAAILRHTILVCSWFPPGKLRDEEMARHIAVVNFLYSVWLIDA